MTVRESEIVFEIGSKVLSLDVSFTSPFCYQRCRSLPLSFTDPFHLILFPLHKLFFLFLFLFRSFFLFFLSFFLSFLCSFHIPSFFPSFLQSYFCSLFPSLHPSMLYSLQLQGSPTDLLKLNLVQFSLSVGLQDKIICLCIQFYAQLYQ